MIHNRVRDSRRRQARILVLLAILLLAFASAANAQNLQYDDKALDLGSRSVAGSIRSHVRSTLKFLSEVILAALV